MAECHPAGDESGGIPIEQGKLQHREERESGDICAARRHTASHFCAAVPKSCKKKEKKTHTRFKLIILMWHVSPHAV